MAGDVTGIDLSDIYNDAFTHEIDTYRQWVSIFVNQIFSRHFIKTSFMNSKTYAEIIDPDAHPSPTACHFTRKIIAYFLDRGNLVVTDNGTLFLAQPIADEDPGDRKLNRFLDQNPDKRNFFGILKNIRDVADQVLFKGEDALLTLANENFRQAMALWEDLMLNASVKQPCHQLVLRVLRQKAADHPAITVFEGGAGIGSILRDGLSDPGFLSVLDRIETYYFTDISLSLIKIGREALRDKLPGVMFDRFVFKTANLDELRLNSDPFTRSDSIDLIILEHVLYDVIDLEKTLRLFNRILKPDGLLVFTMAFRTDPRHFFLFEYLQSTFQSYHKARLEPGFREHIGYLTLGEWERSLKRAGFESFEVYPAATDHIRWPYGGIVATPSK
ncbi:class I SAM-dependent methyltransferase [bacterium]|nr:class I SAM-dependent methyltransferase [bacterium]